MQLGSNDVHSAAMMSVCVAVCECRQLVDCCALIAAMCRRTAMQLAMTVTYLCSLCSDGSCQSVDEVSSWKQDLRSLPGPEGQSDDPVDQSKSNGSYALCAAVLVHLNSSGSDDGAHKLHPTLDTSDCHM
jgi:hypothetical protein